MDAEFTRGVTVPLVRSTPAYPTELARTNGEAPPKPILFEDAPQASVQSTGVAVQINANNAADEGGALLCPI